MHVVPPAKFSAYDELKVVAESKIHQLFRQLFDDLLSQDGGVRFNIISFPPKNQSSELSILFPRIPVSTSENGRVSMWSSLSLAGAPSSFFPLPLSQRHHDSITVQDSRLLNAALLEQYPWLHVFCEEFVLAMYRHVPTHLRDTSTATLEGSGHSDQAMEHLIKSSISYPHDSETTAQDTEEWSQFYLSLRASLRAIEGPFSDIINAVLGVTDLYPSPLVSNSQVYVSRVSALPPGQPTLGPIVASTLPLPADDLLLCHNTKKRARYARCFHLYSTI